MAEENFPSSLPPGGQILIYRDGATNLQVRLDGRTVWLTQAGMAELFQTTPQNVSLHITKIYDDGELDERATCKEYLQVRSEGGRQVERSLLHYSLDVILAVGFRVRSPRGTLFANGRPPGFPNCWSRVSRWTTNGSRPVEPSATTISMNCSPAFATFARANGCSIRKSLIFMPRASITTRISK